MIRKLTRVVTTFTLLATFLVGISVATIAPAQAVATCAEGGPCALGDIGPGGGKVFYISPSTFTCGPTLNLTCKYLEAAPNTWAGGTADPSALWSGNLLTSVTGALSREIGAGYKNTLAIVAQSSTADRAATKSRAYTGNSFTDWYLPSKNELKALTLGKSYVGTFRWHTDYYLSSTQSSNYADGVWASYMTLAPSVNDGYEFEVSKNASGYTFYTAVRPIRAFNDGTLSCAEGGDCVVGDTGPGGGKVFYVSPSTFTCGPTLNLTCKFLEAAPKTWSGGTSDPTAIWAVNDYNPTGQSTTEGLAASTLGRGYRDSISILAYDLEASTVAAGIARTYRGGGKDDWYLPFTAELNLLCQIARGVPQSVTTPCTGGTNSADFNAGGYWTTYGYANDKSWMQNFADGTLSGKSKRNTYSVRPIRAFSGAPAIVDQTTLTVNSASGTFGSDVTLSTSGGSGDGSLSFATSSTNCTITGTKLSVTAAATCSVTATKAASMGYNSATSAAVDIIFAKATPIVTLEYPNSNTVTFSVGGTLAVSTLRPSGDGALTYSSLSAACSVDSSSGLITTLTAGDCNVTLNVAAGTNYLAGSTTTKVVIGLAARTLTIDVGTYTSTYTMLASPPTLTATASFGTGAKSFTTSTSDICAVGSSSGRVTFVAAGTCSLSATIEADSSYSSATSSVISFETTLVRQSTLTVVGNSGIYGGTVTLSESGGEGTGDLTFATSTSKCSISGATLSADAAITCSVTVTKAGDANYSSATSEAVNIIFGKASEVLTIEYLSANTVTYSVNGTLAISRVSKLGDGAISYSTNSTVCSVNPLTGEITTKGAGSCLVTMEVTEGTNYLPGTTTATVVIGKADRTSLVASADAKSASVTFGDNGNSYVIQGFSTGLDGTLTFAKKSGNCSVSGSGVITIAGIGLCVVLVGTENGVNYKDTLIETFDLTVNQFVTSAGTYTGALSVVAGSKANLNSSFALASGCKADLYQYEISGGDGYSNLGTLGTALRSLAINLPAGGYTIRARYVGDSNCAEAVSLETGFVIYDASSSAYGGGSYTNNGRANFAFEIHTLKDKTQKGNFVWNWKGQWRFKGTLSAYGKMSSGKLGSITCSTSNLCGSLSGVGRLEYFDGFNWISVGSAINLNASVVATTATAKTLSPGYIGLSFGYIPTLGQPSLPSPQLIALSKSSNGGGGNIKLI